MISPLFCLVVAISDGDTIKARCGEPGAYEQITIRISAIDAPEKAQPFGQVSRQHLARLCFQQQATIKTRSRDRYARTVADVECRWKDADAAQVQAGLAWAYERYSKGYDAPRPLQSEVRATGPGLWSVEAVAPWNWRKIQAQIKK